MNLGRLGVWYAADKLSPAGWAQFITTAESLGYGALWYSESRGFESMALGSYLLGRSSKIIVGSSIANIYARDAVASRAGMQTLSAISGDRFVLGLGVSHVPLVESYRGHTYGKPVTTMRAYLERMMEDAEDAGAWPLVLAALGPRMLELAAELTRGAVPYNVTPEHTARAKAILGPDKWLVVEQKVCLETDAAIARQLARNELERYMVLENYCNCWRSLGFSADELEGGGCDRFLDAMVAWGDVETIKGRLNEHFDAGATHVCIQPVHRPGDLEAARRVLEALAPGRAGS
jgi:probable F420-dependent oxidoreductase